MAIKKIKLPDNSEQSIQDSRLPEVSSGNNDQMLEVASGQWSVCTSVKIRLNPLSISNMNQTNRGRWFTGYMDSDTGAPSSASDWYSGFTFAAADNSSYNRHICMNSAATKFWFGDSGSWKEVWHSGNLDPNNLPSDSRAKDHQKVIEKEDAFFIIEHLNPKTWVWNEKALYFQKDKTDAGLVAQDVKPILPEAVTVAKNEKLEDYHLLNYTTIQGYEIAAIKGLIEEVKALKTELAEIKNNKNII